MLNTMKKIQVFIIHGGDTLRDENGFSPQKAQDMRAAIVDAKDSTRVFNSAEEVLVDALK